MGKVEIPLNKKKIILLFLGALAFVIFSGLFIINPEQFVSPRMRNPLLIRIFGIAGVLFFGAGTVYGARKLFDNRTGLIIDDNGITDNTSVSGIGLIKWADITEVRTAQVAGNKFLLIYTSDPGIYLDQVKGFKRRLMEANINMYGTPFSITSTALKYDFNDLENLIRERLNEQGGSLPNT